MSANIGHVKNPLTIIAIFASIAEISGTIVLPFVADENQRLFIWFLVSFPTFLVSVFFLTLNFNHKALYAPSDYRDERNFMGSLSPVGAEEKRSMVREELNEIAAESGVYTENGMDDLGEINSFTETTQRDDEQLELLAEMSLVEKLAIYKLSKELNLTFRNDVGINIPNSNRVARFDALGFTEDDVHAVEVKLSKTNTISPLRFQGVVKQAEELSRVYQGIMHKNVTLHIFIVLDDSLADIESTTKKLHQYVENSSVTVKFYITTLDDLKNEYMHNP